MHLSNLKKIVLNIMLLTGSSSQRTEAAHPPKTLIEWQNEHDKSPDQSGKSISGMLYIQSNRHVNDLISTILDKGNYPLAEYALKTTGNGQYTLTKEGENEIPLDPRGLNWWLIAENISKAMDCIKNKQHFDIQVQKTDSADPAMVTAFKDINLYWEILHIGEYLTDTQFTPDPPAPNPDETGPKCTPPQEDEQTVKLDPTSAIPYLPNMYIIPHSATQPQIQAVQIDIGKKGTDTPMVLAVPNMDPIYPSLNPEQVATHEQEEQIKSYIQWALNTSKLLRQIQTTFVPPPADANPKFFQGLTQGPINRIGWSTSGPITTPGMMYVYSIIPLVVRQLIRAPHPPIQIITNRNQTIVSFPPGSDPRDTRNQRYSTKPKYSTPYEEGEKVHDVRIVTYLCPPKVSFPSDRIYRWTIVEPPFYTVEAINLKTRGWYIAHLEKIPDQVVVVATRYRFAPNLIQPYRVLEKQIQRYLHESVSFSETQYALALSYPGAREEFEEYQRQLQANNVQFEKKGNSTIIIGPNAEFGLVNHPLLLKVVDAKTDNFSLWPADTKFPFIDRTAKTGEGAKPTRGK